MNVWILSLISAVRSLVVLGIAFSLGWAELAQGVDLPLASSSTNQPAIGEKEALLQGLHAASHTGTDSLKASDSRNGLLSGRIDNMDALDDHYKLRIGDRISFRVIEDEDGPKELTVTDSGDLEIPYVGLFAATGKTCKELSQALKVELEKEYYYRATVIIAVDQWAKSQGKVYIVGPVRSPGPQEIPSDEVFVVSKAVLRAGGFSDYADQRKVRVTRKSAVPGGKEQEFIVNVEDALKRGNRTADMTLQDGDLILVPERLVHF